MSWPVAAGVVVVVVAVVAIAQVVVASLPVVVKAAVAMVADAHRVRLVADFLCKQSDWAISNRFSPVIC